MNDPPARHCVTLLAITLLCAAGTRTRADFGTVINVPPQPAPDYIDSDTQLNVFGSGQIGDDLIAGSFSGQSSQIEINVHGGGVGENLSLNAGSTLNLSGGAIGEFGDAFSGSRVHMTGGVLGDFFDANGGSQIRLAGGSVGVGFDAFSGSVVDIVGGAIGDDFNAGSGSLVQIVGKRFFLDATEITPSLIPGEPATLTLRGATLSGLLADDTPFSFDLNVQNEPLQDYFDPFATLSLVLLHPADYDRSGVVDLADYSAWTQQYGSQGPLTADGNGDGVVDAGDYTLWRDALSADEAAPATAVPSPAALSMGWVAWLAAMLTLRRKGRNPFGSGG